MKDTFVGQINQLKTAKAPTPVQKTDFPDMSPALKLSEQKKQHKSTKPRSENLMKSAIELYSQINDTTFAKV